MKPDDKRVRKPVLALSPAMVKANLTIKTTFLSILLLNLLLIILYVKVVVGYPIVLTLESTWTLFLLTPISILFGPFLYLKIKSSLDKYQSTGKEPK